MNGDTPDRYAGGERSGVFTNTGYHGTACGFIVRDGRLWVATFETEKEADEYVAWKNSPQPLSEKDCAAIVAAALAARSAREAKDIDDLLGADQRAYGTSYLRIDADGTRTRIDPATVMIAEQPAAAEHDREHK